MKKIVAIFIIALLSIITVNIQKTYAYWDGTTTNNSSSIVIGDWAYPWNSTTNYLIGNIVTYNSIIYIAKKASRNKIPSPTSQFWTRY